MSEKEKKSLVVRLTPEEHAWIQERRQQEELGEFDLAAIRPGMPREEVQKALRVIGAEMRRANLEVDALRSYVSEKTKTREGTREILLEVGRALRAERA